MEKLKRFLTLILAITLGGSALPANAFLLPGNVNSASETSSSGSSLGKFLASTGSVGEERNQLGSSDRKEDKVPKVDVIITPTHPSVDELVYAQALPQNFRNSSSNLYYNWYIYNPDPKVGSVVIKDGQKVFIPGNTLEGALIRGAIAQARGSYIPGVTPKAKEMGKANESPEQDKDGYNAHYGGDDGQGAIEKKIKDILGKDYDFTYQDFKTNCKQNCKVEYNNSENENAWKYDKCAEPTCGDWINNCCSGAKNDFTSCISDIWDDVQSSCFDRICDKKSDGKKDDCYRTLSLSDYATCDNNFFDKETTCADDRNLYCLNRGSCGTKPSQDCTDCEKEYHKKQWEALKDRDLCEKQCEVKDNNSLGGNSVEPVGSRCFRYNFGGRDTGDHLAGVFQPVTCTHYFPGSENPDNVVNWEEKIPFKTGDGSFKDSEELFWGTDPTNADTDGDNFSDEADISGQGQQTVQFKYQNGDKIGVTVEGTSLFPTNDKTPYYKIMWAYSGVCSSEVIRSAGKDTPEFNNFCRCEEKDKEDKCKDSDDFGFGYLKLNDIWQNVTDLQNDRLETFIDLSPLRPVVGSPLTLEAIVSGGELGKEMLSYEWTLKHGGEVLRPEQDQKNSRIVWKKQGVEAAYTKLVNQLADFKNQGGVGWEKLNLEPLLEGSYDVLVKAIETNNNKQKMGEGTLNLNVSENLKIRFFRSSNSNNVWTKKDELTSGEAIPDDTIIAEYDGPFYDDFVWLIDRKKLEGSGPRVSLPVNKGANSSYNFKLVATNKNRTNTAEKEFSLKIINPYVSLRLRGEAPDNMNSSTSEQSLVKKNGLTYQVPIGKDLEFLTIRNPAGSSFSVRDDLHYFWSFDEAESKEGEDSYKVTLEGKNFLPGTPHSLEVKIYSSERKLLARDKITLVPTNDNNSKIVEDSKHTIAGLALAYLNMSDKLRFSVQTLLWTFFIYLLLSGIAWLMPIKQK